MLYISCSCLLLVRSVVIANGYWRFILPYVRASGNWLAVFPSIIRNFGKTTAPLATCFYSALVRLILRPWRWRRNVPPKHRLIFNGFFSVISQKIEPFEIYFISANTEVSFFVCRLSVCLSVHTHVWRLNGYTNFTLVRYLRVYPSMIGARWKWASWVQNWEPLRWGKKK
jgi:hypothetical protein